MNYCYDTNMDIQGMLQGGRDIWGDTKLSLEEVLVRLNVVVGDISRLARDRQEGAPVSAATEAELQKELGNVIFSMIRWCDDLGYSPQECVELAKRAQAAYMKKRR